MSTPDHVTACCNTPPFKSNYTPKGLTETVADIPVYFAGEKGKSAIILVHDIFGLKANTMQLADTLAAHGFRVAAPDCFRGNPYETVPVVMADLRAHLLYHAPPEVVLRDSQSIAAHLRAEGAQKVGALGLCWGGRKVCELAAVEGAVDAVASAHPSQIDEAVVDAITVPVCFLPSMSEPDYVSIDDFLCEGILAKKPFAARNVHRRFTTMRHGWIGARANYDDPENVKGAQEATDILADFFKANL
ncbi:Alpha/Beta hydrolase protein [Blyttiomyces helicus]|uniref:Alpha/Beta hydrolase protein n=1 Tax=Blyttiomyces helicus TaxID=388810 RepID=A0A4P9W5P9_9FUNG|nr:Alpha/Beta hydrolase protein [Blyttiomyces helicus]|eukprot:RKO85426.1 Alpha/Beta hydrolase protein [Blyttiomyces helicus]